MIFPLHLAIRTAGNQDHRQQTYKVWNHHQESDRCVGVKTGKRFHELWHPEGQRVHADIEGETDTGQVPHAAVDQRLCCRNFSMFLILFLLQFLSDPVLFVPRQKFGFRWTAWQQEVRKYTADYGWNSLQNQEPPPTAHTEPVNSIQNETGDRSPQNAGDR